MRFLNKVILIGRVGSLNLKSKTNAAGVTTRILDISVVTPKVIKNKATGEFVEKPIWHSISVFGDSVIDYALKFEKGDVIYIYGYLDVIKLITATGEEKKIFKVVVDISGEIKLFEKRRQVDTQRDEDKSSSDGLLSNDFKKKKYVNVQKDDNDVSPGADSSSDDDDSLGF